LQQYLNFNTNGLMECELQSLIEEGKSKEKQSMEKTRIE